MLFDTSVFIDWFIDFIGVIAPLAFVVTLVRLGFKMIINAVSGRSDLFE